MPTRDQKKRPAARAFRSLSRHRDGALYMSIITCEMTENPMPAQVPAWQPSVGGPALGPVDSFTSSLRPNGQHASSALSGGEVPGVSDDSKRTKSDLEMNPDTPAWTPNEFFALTLSHRLIASVLGPVERFPRQARRIRVLNSPTLRP